MGFFVFLGVFFVIEFAVVFIGLISDYINDVKKQKNAKNQNKSKHRTNPDNKKSASNTKPSLPDNISKPDNTSSNDGWNRPPESGWHWIFESPEKQAGHKGENLAFREIVSISYPEDIVISNVEIEFEDKKTELDIVVINRFGVFIVEVKNYHGKIVGEVTDYEWQKYKMTDAGNVYEKTVRNPIKQVKREEYLLAHFLRSNGIHGVWVKGYVRFVEGNSPVYTEEVLLNRENVARAIHTPARNDGRMIDRETVERIARLLYEHIAKL